MCTATWRYHDAGYELFFNRDELHRRSEAIPPKIIGESSTRFIAPIDPDGGGTWMGVNEWGITVALLNFYPSSDEQSTSSLIGPSGSNRSRGLLVTSLLSCRDYDGIRSILNNERLTDYRPFSLLVLNRKRQPMAFQSVEKLTEISEPVMPFTSSSYKTSSVIANRLSVYESSFGPRSYAATAPATDELFAYHKSHKPERSAESVCMHRHDGETRSFTYIHVDQHEGLMRYTQGSPCITEPLDDVTIRLR